MYAGKLTFFQLAYSEISKAFTNEASANASKFDWQNFQNKTLKNVFQGLANKGWAALSDAEFTEVSLSFLLCVVYFIYVHVFPSSTIVACQDCYL